MISVKFALGAFFLRISAMRHTHVPQNVSLLLYDHVTATQPMTSHPSYWRIIYMVRHNSRRKAESAK